MTASTRKNSGRVTPAELQLPKERTPRSLSAEHAKVLLYGHPKVGKSTLAAGLDPDHTLFIATEPGLGGLEVFSVPVGGWDEFRTVGAALAYGDHEFTTVIVDTVDELAKMCTEYAMEQLGLRHPSEAGYGKGWAAVSDEFRLRVAKLCSLGLGVWFISHAKDREIERRVGSVTKTIPTLQPSLYEWLSGFVDYIFLAEVVSTEDGPVRQLRTSATEHYEAGGRYVLPDPIDMDAGELAQIMKEASQ